MSSSHNREMTMEGFLRAAVEALKRRTAKGEQVRRLRRPGGCRPFGKSSYDDGVRIATAAAKKYDQDIKKIK